MTLDRFERRELLRALRSIVAILDEHLAEVDLNCEHHQRLTIRPVQCPECRADIMDARADLPVVERFGKDN